MFRLLCLDGVSIVENLNGFGNDFLTSASPWSRRNQNSFASGLIQKIRYHLSRVIVLVIAMQILNLSIDTDHIFHGRLRLGTGHRDDIDSFVEMIVEGITGNHSLFPESHGEDQHSFNKLTQKIVCDNIRNLYPTIKTPDKPVNITSEPDRGCQFISNDFSALFCPPPDLA